ncbi:hypothetical protein, partial [Amphritea atlantica]
QEQEQVDDFDSTFDLPIGIEESRPEKIPNDDLGFFDDLATLDDEEQEYLYDLWADDEPSEEDGIFDSPLVIEEPISENISNDDLDFPDDVASSESTEQEDFYDFWTDDKPSVEDGPGNTITRSQRARQMAAQVIDTVGWSKSELGLITDIFIDNGWSATKTTLIREIELGASVEEITLARELKLIWKECDRYWIYFGAINRFYEHTTASYRHFSWKQALRIIRTYNGYPCIEEIHEMLEVEFEYWYSKKILRRKYPAFINYLIYYRFSDAPSMLPASDSSFFFDPIDEETLDSDDLELEGSDMYHALSEYGINLHNNFTTKSYYTSDIPFDQEEGKLLVPERKIKRIVKVQEIDEFDEDDNED